MRWFLAFAGCLPVAPVAAQDSAAMVIHETTRGARVSPTMQGVFFEEISHAGEGGLYAELIQNRGFEEANIPPGMTLRDGVLTPPRTPAFTSRERRASDWTMPWTVAGDLPAWSLVLQGHASATMQRTNLRPLNAATPHSLALKIKRASAASRVDVVNDGFWGIPVREGSRYRLSFFLRSAGAVGPVIARLESAGGKTLASATIRPGAPGPWRKYSAWLNASAGDSAARLAISFSQPATIWLDMVSLFPEHTFRDRPNGLRKDLAEFVAGLKPAFMRWPGGCYVEGITIQSAPDWKKTLGPQEGRTQTYSPWGYYSSNGFGYHEYLQFCEDIGASALFVVNAGVSCEFRSGTFIPDDSLAPYIASAVDAVEYAIGPVSSAWGRRRAQAGHPKPFPLRYVEVGNEQSGPRYAERFNRFYQAIKARFPGIEVIASMGIGDVNDYTARKIRQTDFADEHSYKPSGWAFNHFDHFDRYPRGPWRVYVGEYATNAGVGAGNMEAALNDAVYWMGMEHNGDLVTMSSYAPLLVNVRDEDWPVNLIHFDAARSFARISYYALQLFGENKPTNNLAADLRYSRPARPSPAFSGGIGLATWDTKSEYKDIEVDVDGKTIYRSDSLADWSPVRGVWERRDGAFAQTAWGAQQLALLENRRFDRYTLKLKARKKEGFNAFIVPFGVSDSNTMYRAHIGAWLNRAAMFEKVTNGFDVANISTPVDLKDSIVTDRWYDIRLEVGADTVRCFLDDRLLMTYAIPPQLFAIAGIDSATGETIVKIVNANAHSVPFRLTRDGGEPWKAMQQIVLSADAPGRENSFSEPTRFVPRKSGWQTIDPGQPVSVALEPYSVNVLRFRSN